MSEPTTPKRKRHVPTRDKTGKPVYDENTKEVIRFWTTQAECKTWIQARDLIAKKLGVHYDNVTRAHKRKGPLWVDPRFNQFGISSPAGAEYVTEVETSVPKTLDEVVQLCAVDMEKWEAKSFGVVKKHGGAFGWNVRFSKKIVNPLLTTESIKELVAQISESRPNWSKVKPAKTNPEDSLYLLGMVDTHIGKLAHGEETGWDDYDSKIAVEEYRKSREALLGHISPERVGRVLIPVGNDLLHVDSQLNETAHGTKQDVDSRVHKLFQTATSLMIETITMVAKNYPVDVVVVRSNHDYNTIFYLGEVLKAYFHEHPNVTINNAPTARKYYKFGNSLLAFTHGDSEKQESLPLTMANECKNDWASTTQRFWICGHYHREIVKDIQGVRVFILPSLSSPDSWHSKNGYVGVIRGSVGMEFDKTDGLVAQYYHSAPSFSRYGLS